MKKLFLFLTLAIHPCALMAQPSGYAAQVAALPSEKKAPIKLAKFSKPPVIDGKLDEELWKSAAIFKDFIQIRPGDNIAPSKQTIAYAGYDSQNLYFGIHCFDEPDKIRATVAKRDDVGGDDNVRISLDTFNDQRRAYLLMFNPLGIQGDGIIAGEGQGGGGGGGPGGADLSVDIVMESKGALLGDGWSVEVKVPFKSLRFASGKGQLWGINFSRNIARFNDEASSWMPIERGVPGVRQYGKITGLEGIKQERTLEIVPGITLSQNGERIPDAAAQTRSRIVNRPVKQDIGVSIKYQVTPNVTVDVAVNPDFAEVEADAPVLRANERFPIFFPEKRPFFLEGIDYFRSPLQVVNTRNIADPDVAVKLTGKTGKNTFAILTAVDRFPDTDTKAYIGVLRLRRDIGKLSNIGLFATTYHFGSKLHNNLLGFDGKFQLTPKSAFNYMVVGTHSRREFYNPDIDDIEYRTGNGVAYDVNYDYTGRDRGFRFGVNGRSRDYRADVGFTRRTNTHGFNGGFRIGTPPKPEKMLVNVVTRTFYNAYIDESGRWQDGGIRFFTELNFQKQLRVGFEAGVGHEKIYEDEFGARRNSQQLGVFFGNPERGATQYSVELDFDKNFNKRFSMGGGISYSTNDFDLDFGSGERYPRVSPAFLANPFETRLDPGKGNSLGYGIGLDLTPTDPWTLSLNYEKEKLARKDTKLTAFDSNIFSLRSTYQFTRFTFFRARWDYQALDGSVNGQFLFGWSPNPGTAFYVGYNDNLYYRGFNEFTGRFDDGFRRDERRFFIRMSYLFRRSI